MDTLRTLKDALAVFLGGGAGAVCRYLLAVLLKNPSRLPAFPLSTFLVNLVGSLLIGILSAYALKHPQDFKLYRLLLVSGFCGGFTTFSSFSYENIQLLQKGDYLTAFLYIFLSLLGSGAACALGFFSVR